MLSSTSRLVGLVIATAMFVFSAVVYFRSGDWVAVIFMLGSLGYGAFFLMTGGDDT
jgi:hypothetical protein